MARWLFGMITVLAVLYGGYWFVASSAFEREAQAALDDLREAGWDISTPPIDTRGFPSRFDTRLTPLRVTTPDGRLGLDAPGLAVTALSYRPNEVILVWPDRFDIYLGDTRFDVMSDRLRTSAAVEVGTDLAVDRAILGGTFLQIRPFPPGEPLQPLFIALDPLAAMRRQPDRPGAYDVHIKAADVSEGGRAYALRQVSLDAVAVFSAPLALRGPDRPRLEAIETITLDITAPDARAWLTGRLAPDAAGYAEGTLTLRTTQGAALVAGLSEWDRITPPLTLALQALVELAESDAGLDLIFADGVVSAGPIPLFAAPRLN